MLKIRDLVDAGLEVKERCREVITIMDIEGLENIEVEDLCEGNYTSVQSDEFYDLAKVDFVIEGDETWYVSKKDFKDFMESSETIEEFIDKLRAISWGDFMKDRNLYCCSLYPEKDEFKNHMFSSFEKAKEEGLRIIKEYNKHFKEQDYLPEETVFSDELKSLILIPKTCPVEIVLKEIHSFYIHEFAVADLPENLGEVIIDVIDSEFWAGYEGVDLQKHLGKKKVKKLNRLIYNFIKKETKDYKKIREIDFYKVEVDLWKTLI